MSLNRTETVCLLVPYLTCLIAGGVHAAKTARPAVTTATGGMGNWLVSLAEDVLSFIIAFVAILVPLLVLLVIAGW